MRIVLYLMDKLVEFHLPKQVAGSFSFGIDENEESQLINIEARNGNWVLYQTADVLVFDSGMQVNNTILKDQTFYMLQKGEQNYLIYVAEIIFPGFQLYSYTNNMHLVIGNTSTANIKYNNPYLNALTVVITVQENGFLLEKQGSTVIYINHKAFKENKSLLKIGDEIEILGLRLILIKNVLLISQMNQQLAINATNANISLYQFIPKVPLVDRELKDVELYSKEDYYAKSPRLRRLIESKIIKLSQAPKEGTNNEIPVILVIGPMLTMGIMSGTMLLNTVFNIYSKKTTLNDSWPQLVTSGAMLVSMLVWPFITQIYNRRMKKKKEQEIVQKYTVYLNEKKQELEKEAKLQREILYENLITIPECLNIIKTKGVNFWDKRIDQKDFLVVRIGLGNEKLNVKVEYPEEGFSIEESKLKEQADSLVAAYQYIQNVPIGYSFYENKTTAIMGENKKVRNFVHNILLQLITFYSYEDIKLVLFTNQDHEQEWDYLRYLNHSFSNDRSIRFFAADQESIKTVAEYLQMELTMRANQIKENKQPLFKPHYFVVVDDYDKVRHQEFIKTITETDANLGFSLVILESRLSRLPSKCNNFITISEKESGVLKNSYENQEQITFQNEITPNINMMNVVKILSNIPIEFADGLNQLPDSITFLEMEKVGKVEQLNIFSRWNSNDATTSLKAEVGVDEQGDLMYLDLHEKYHGPHGLIAGMTGSGKSEFIITYILSMAINYSPDDVAFILIDYKGGGLAGAFENKSLGMVLPHLAGTITNLDKAEMDRTLVSIESEIKRRQKIFNEARDNLGQSTIDIYKYQKFYKEGKIQEPVPHLFIICDEFAELKSQQPAFMDNLISVARIGRSLGIHLILATQKPSGVVNEQIWSNTKFRVCLKVQDEQDSREMLKRPEAASIKQVGRYYLQVGYDELFVLGQSAWCGAKYYPSDKIVKQVDKSVNFIDDCGQFIKSIQAASNQKMIAHGEQLTTIMQSVITVANQLNKRTRRLWLDNIPPVILVDDLIQKYQVQQSPYQISAVLGEYDAPEKQEQGLVAYHYTEDGNMIIYGNDGAEREQLLDTLIYSTVKYHNAEEIQFYFIDYGSESLRRYVALPQVGGVVIAGEDEKYYNLIKLLKEELQSRKKLFAEVGGDYLTYIKNTTDKLPLKVIILNNYDSIYEANPDIYDELPELLRDSQRYGLIFIFTANAVNSIQSKLSQNCPFVLSFKLKDNSDYGTAFGMRTKIVPRDIFARGLLKNDGVHEFQTASIVADDAVLNDYLQPFIQTLKQDATSKAKRIPTLPAIIRLRDVDEEISNLHHVPIGISKKELDICTFDFLANIGSIITSNKLANTEFFVRSLLQIFKEMRNVVTIVLDPMKLLLLDTSEYPNYYNNYLEEVIAKLNEYIQSLIVNKQNIEGIIVIYGINKLIAKIKDASKLEVLVKLLKEYEKIGLVIVDDAAKIKNYTFESWFSNIFSINDGMWIGRGMADQNLLHISTITKEMTKDYKNDMGYLVNESMATLCKYIDFITEEEK